MLTRFDCSACPVSLLILSTTLVGGCCTIKDHISNQESVLLERSEALTLTVRNNTSDPLILLALDDLESVALAPGAMHAVRFRVSSVVRIAQLIEGDEGWLEDAGEARTLVAVCEAGAPCVLWTSGMMEQIRVRVPGAQTWAFDIELGSCVLDAGSPTQRDLIIEAEQELGEPLLWCE